MQPPSVDDLTHQRRDQLSAGFEFENVGVLAASLGDPMDTNLITKTLRAPNKASEPDESKFSLAVRRSVKVSWRTMAYRVILLLHIAGAVATFVGVGALFLVALTMRRVRRTEEVMSLAWTYEMAATVGLLGILLVAASGLYMAATVWGLSRDWILVAIGAFALLAPVGPIIVIPRIELIIQLARKSGEGPVPPELVARTRDPIPKLGLLAILGDLVGIVCVMTLKPSFAGSIAAVLICVALGMLLGIPSIGKVVGSAIHAFATLERNSPLYRR